MLASATQWLKISTKSLISQHCERSELLLTLKYLNFGAKNHCDKPWYKIRFFVHYLIYWNFSQFRSQNLYFMGENSNIFNSWLSKIFVFSAKIQIGKFTSFHQKWNLRHNLDFWPDFGAKIQMLKKLFLALKNQVFCLIFKHLFNVVKID